MVAACSKRSVRRMYILAHEECSVFSIVYDAASRVLLLLLVIDNVYIARGLLMATRRQEDE